MESGAGVRTVSLDPSDLDRYRAAKGEQTVAVCVPCRNESATIGAMATMMVEELLVPGLVDDVVVIDDNSSDDSAALAAEAGARVVSIDLINRRFGPGRGKGNVLWGSLSLVDADVIVWCDADVVSFAADWVIALAQPLLADHSLQLVKAFYERPTDTGGGGRTTELVARPILSLYFPELAPLHQPLAGEYAIRRSAGIRLPFVQGWGVEIALLIDMAERYSASAIAQVDLGLREHRHRPLADLAVQSGEVMAAALSRTPVGKGLLVEDLQLTTAAGDRIPLNVDERRPLVVEPGEPPS